MHTCSAVGAGDAGIAAASSKTFFGAKLIRFGRNLDKSD